MNTFFQNAEEQAKMENYIVACKYLSLFFQLVFVSESFNEEKTFP